MAAIFVICSCGYPNALGAPTERMLDTLRESDVERKCTHCGARLNNDTAFIGQWHANEDGSGGVRECDPGLAGGRGICED